VHGELMAFCLVKLLRWGRLQDRTIKIISCSIIKLVIILIFDTFSESLAGCVPSAN
jgi:hypothetical protein